MDVTNTARSISGQGALIHLLGIEIQDAVFELRFMIGAMIILTLADFWWATRELRYRREKALRAGNAELAKVYEYRGSRAGRRTLNKIVDYLTYLLVGAFLGYAITEPLGCASHITTAAIGLGLGCAFDVSSIIGHVLAVKGLKWDVKEFFVGLFKTKAPELGEVLEESIVEEAEDYNRSLTEEEKRMIKAHCDRNKG